MKTSDRSKKNLPLTVFDEPSVKKRVYQLFDSLEEETQKRVSEIVEFLNEKSIKELSYDSIMSLFRDKYCRKIANEAVEMALYEQGKYNILDNIVSLLSEESLRNAVMGETMIDAFSDAIRSIPTNNAWEAVGKGSNIVLLKQKYLGWSSPLFPKKEEGKQNNFCGLNGCSCICDKGCNGDRQKCTSEKAIATNCNHRCECFIGMIFKR